MKYLSLFVLILALTSCSCGQDYLVVQMDYEGKIINCWELHDTRVSSSTTRVQWFTPDRNVVYISGVHNVVKVKYTWESAYKELGVSRDQCKVCNVRKAEEE